MTKSQSLQLRMSEIRQRLISEPDLEQTERDKLTNEFSAKESEFRAALIVENEERNKETNLESRASDLVDRLSLPNFLTAAISGTEVRGAELEYMTEAKLPSVDGLGWTVIPWEVVAPGADDETRADVTTPAPGNLKRSVRTPLQRIFSAGIAQYLGVSMPSVGYGEQQWSRLSTAGTAQTVTAGTAIESTAAAFATYELTGIRSGISYSIRQEDISKLGPVLENSLAADMRAALNDLVDTQILTGDGTTTSGVTSPTGLLAHLTAGDDPGSVAGIGDYQAAVVDAIDGGIHAATEADVRLLLGTDSYKQLAKLTDTDKVRQIARLRGEVSGLRSTDKMPAAASNIQQALAIGTRNLAGSAVAPIWQGMRILRDPYTNSNSSTIHLRAAMLWNFDVIRTEPFDLLKFKLA